MTNISQDKRGVKKYFNPHSREGSDSPWTWADNYAAISIHTPAKGVTTSLPKYYIDQIISIHTPAKGVTTMRPWYTSTTVISIHTPAKGVTYHGTGSTIKRRHFNPHSREGSDINDKRRNKIIGDFNPHSREGSDKEKEK